VLLRFALISLASMSCLAPRMASAQEAEDFHFIPGTFEPRIGPDGNTEIYTAPSGLVVIDTGRHPDHAQKILDYASSRSLPIVAVVNTHWHFDHTTGNLDMKAAYPEAQVYATRAIDDALEGFLAAYIESARAAQDDQAVDPESRKRDARFLAAVDQGVVQPDVEVETTITLPVSGRDLELHVTHDAVSASDIWVWDPVTRTVIAGDLVTLPAPLFDTGCVDGWIEAFDDIETKPYHRVVPGHGFIMNADEFRLYRRAFENLVACAAERSGAECAPGWLGDAVPLLDKATGQDYGDQNYAEQAVAYYVDNIIRSPEKQAACARLD